MYNLFVLGRNTWNHTTVHILFVFGRNTWYNCANKWSMIKKMQWKYSYDYNQTFTIESSFGIK